MRFVSDLKLLRRHKTLSLNLRSFNFFYQATNEDNHRDEEQRRHHDNHQNNHLEALLDSLDFNAPGPAVGLVQALIIEAGADFVPARNEPSHFSVG